MRFKARTLLFLAPWLAAVGGCSVLVHPDENRLEPGDGSTADGSHQQGDATSNDGAVDDAPGNPDAPTSDVPASDVPNNPDATMSCASGCDDHVACTVDQCNTQTGQCTHTADSSMCGPRMICDPAMGCITHECSTDAECDDHDACNGAEMCQGNRCVPGTMLHCDDGRFCNGTETCNPASGCVPGTAPDCSDTDACTMDGCDPTAAGGVGACVHPPIPGCVPGAPPNDVCTSASAITLGANATQTVTGTTEGAGDGVDSACGGPDGGDVWYAVTYPANQDLRVEVTGTDAGDPVVVLRDGCTSADLVCNDDATRHARDSRVWLRAERVAGSTMRTVYVVVDAYQAGDESAFTLRLTTTTAVGDTSCSGTQFDVSSGGTVRSPGRAGTGSNNGSCGGWASAEEVYVLNGSNGMGVELTATTASYSPVVYVRGTPCNTGMEAACHSGNPVRFTYNQPAAGRSYIFVDGLGLTTANGAYTLRAYTP